MNESKIRAMKPSIVERLMVALIVALFVLILTGIAAPTQAEAQGNTGCLPNPDQVAIFVESNFQGACALLEIGQYANLSQLSLDNRPALSLRVGANVVADLCLSEGFLGGCELFSVDASTFAYTRFPEPLIRSLRVYSLDPKPHRISFDERTAGAQITNQYLSTHGVFFPELWPVDGPLDTQYPEPQIIVAYGSQSSSSPNVLGGPGMVHVDFVAGQSRVKVVVGGQTAPAITSLVLEALNKAGDPVGNRIVRNLPAGTHGVFYTLEIRRASADIFAVRMWSEDENGRYYSIGIDDLEFDTAQPLVDTEPPVVHITSPQQGATVTGSLFPLAGTVLDNSNRLAKVWITVSTNGQYHQLYDLHNLRRDGDTFVFGHGGNYGHLELGENVVTVHAMDISGNVGQSVITLTSQHDPSKDSDIDIRITGYDLVQVIHRERAVTSSPFPGYGVEWADQAQYYPPPGGLLARRQTVLRVYGDFTSAQHPRIQVNAQLYGRLNGVWQPLSTTVMAQQPVWLEQGRTLNDQREHMEMSWNFLLPPQWTAEGEINLVVTLDHHVTLPDGRRLPECPGCSGINNRLVIHRVSFEPAPRLTVHPFQVCVRRTSGVPREQCAMPTMKQIHQTLYGADSIVPQVMPTDIVRFRPLSNPVIYIDGEFSQNGLVSSSKMGDALSKVDKRRRMDLGFGADPLNRIYYGMIPSPIGDAAGKAYTGNGTGVGMVEDLNGDTTAHEIGHAIGLKHVPSPVDAADNIRDGCWQDGQPARANKGYPYYRDLNNVNYLRSSIGVLGLDVRKLALYSPQNTHDMMSYCDPAWISPYYYQRLLSILREAEEKQSAMAAIAASPAAQQPLIFVTGMMGANHSLLEFGPLYVMDGIEQPATESQTTVRLVDAQGAILSTAPITLDPIGDAEADMFMLASTIAPAPGMASLQLLHGTSVLTAVVVSAHAPAVQLTQPNGGEFWPTDMPALIRWSATDADGDALFYAVQYSRDAGSTWTTLAVDLTTNKLTIAPEHLAGSDVAMVRVLASDGINTTAATSQATFQVADRAPVVTILQPISGTVVAAGQRLRLSATAYDYEEELSDANLRWTIFGIGEIGSGYEIDLDSTGLSGRHTIAVEVIDRSGNSAHAEVEIEIMPAPVAVEVTTARFNPTCIAGASPTLELAWATSSLDAESSVLVEVTDPFGRIAPQFFDNLPSSGGLSLPMAYPQSGTLEVTFTAYAHGDSTVTKHVVVEAPVCYNRRLALSHAQLNFATLLIGNQVAQTVTLYNTSSQPLTVNKLSVSGAFFALANAPALPTFIPAGGQLPVMINFSPTEAVSTTGELVIDMPDLQPSTLQLPLLGMGVALPNEADIAVMPGFAIEHASATSFPVEILVTNHGPGVAQDVILQVNGSAPAQFTNVYVNGAQCAVNANQLRCELGALAPGAAIPLQLDVTGIAAAAFSGRFEVNASTVDTVFENNVVEIKAENETENEAQQMQHFFPLIVRH